MSGTYAVQAAAHYDFIGHRVIESEERYSDPLTNSSNKITSLGVIGLISVVATGPTLSLMSAENANRSRILANHFEKQEEQTSDPNAAKIFGTLSTYNRIKSVAQGFLSASFALLGATFIAYLAHNVPDFQQYLVDGAIAGAAFFGAGALTMYAAQKYKEAKKEELEEAAGGIVNASKS